MKPITIVRRWRAVTASIDVRRPPTTKPLRCASWGNEANWKKLPNRQTRPQSSSPVLPVRQARGWHKSSSGCSTNQRSKIGTGASSSQSSSIPIVPLYVHISWWCTLPTNQSTNRRDAVGIVDDSDAIVLCRFCGSKHSEAAHWNHARDMTGWRNRD